MNKQVMLSTLLISQTLSGATSWQPLENAPETIEKVHEIALVYNQKLAELYNALTPQERVFMYYMFRASLPGLAITTQQTHRHSLEIQGICEYIFDRQEQLQAKNLPLRINIDQCIQDLKTYLVYIWTNHGQYFRREDINEKRTPARLGLPTLTPENLSVLLAALEYPNAHETVQRLSASIFDQTYEPTLTVPGSIEKSAINFYEQGFTAEDFAQIDAALQTAINAYFGFATQQNNRIPQAELCKVGGKLDKELSISLHWLDKAHAYAQQFPEHFDKHLVKSLEYLCEFVKTGQEDYFKQHSIEWLKSKSKLDYCFGFIEVYHDPKSYRGEFQAEVTIKSLDINAVNALLPTLEQQLPFPVEYKRQNLHDLSAIPNASINTKIFAFGGLGPQNITLAYCLPNYSEIRTEYGSKQIIYHSDKGLEELINAEYAQQLSYLHEQDVWFKEHDPEGELRRTILNLHVILHETLGHGSGKLDKHTFVENEPLTIENKTYTVGDTLQVTNTNLAQFLAGYSSTLEELRAEIIALYSSIHNYDELAQSGLLGDWPQNVSKDAMIELCILDMGYFGLRRLLNHDDNATVIAGDHARANTTILNYLIDHGGIEIVQEQKIIKGNDYTVVGIRVINREKAIQAITQLAQCVQKIKSTGDTLGVQALIETYGKPIRNPEFITLLKQNRRAIIGELKVSASLFPHFEPVTNKEGTIIDINAKWPKDIIEQYRWFKKLMYSKE